MRPIRNRGRLILGPLVLALFCGAAFAQAPATGPSTELRTGPGLAYPNKPVRMLIGPGAGGPTDVMARTYASKMTEIWGPGIAGNLTSMVLLGSR